MRDSVPSATPPSSKVTVPVAALGETVAVKVTATPYWEVLLVADEVKDVIVEAILKLL